MPTYYLFPPPLQESHPLGAAHFGRSGAGPMVDRRPPRGTRRLWSWARRATVPAVCVVTVVALGRTGALVDAEIINVKVTRSIVRSLLLS